MSKYESCRIHSSFTVHNIFPYENYRRRKLILDVASFPTTVRNLLKRLDLNSFVYILIQRKIFWLDLHFIPKFFLSTVFLITIILNIAHFHRFSSAEKSRKRVTLSRFVPCPSANTQTPFRNTPVSNERPDGFCKIDKFPEANKLSTPYQLPADHRSPRVL